MKRKIKVLIADDDPILRRLIKAQLNSDEFETSAIGSGMEILNSLREEDFDVILLDINLPDVSGLEILQAIKTSEDAPEVVMLTADSTLKTGVEAMRLGAFDYLTKPAPPELIEQIVRKANEKHSLVQQNQRLKAVVRQQDKNSTQQPVHQSEVMKKIFAQAEMVAKINTTLLITGESGTGKDVLARWIHSQSPRGDLPIVSINCGALPENLFESEFFGHEKGSFTGATNQKIGLIEAADNSTLFLDEIGEMPLSMQVKLLHFLENGSFRRLGATRDKQADVRVIAATNRPLEEDIKEGKFRSDLYYRLNVISFHIPPLRERRDDISSLVNHFLDNFKNRFNRQNLEINEEAFNSLLNNSWLGNVRELKNTLERAVVLSPTDLITEIYGLKNNTIFFEKSAGIENIKEDNKPILPLAEIEKIHILEVLKKVGGKREKAAAALGITARTLYRKLNEYNLDTDKITLK
ncbi:MAG: sigma-54 dependent transcriptional regulator [Pyrinomonadaceae bacterium]|nr:sigma-54 dependent transcriptional regulator [Pyrinomonadaceae bacterium]